MAAAIVDRGDVGGGDDVVVVAGIDLEAGAEVVERDIREVERVVAVGAATMTLANPPPSMVSTPLAKPEASPTVVPSLPTWIVVVWPALPVKVS